MSPPMTAAEALEAVSVVANGIVWRSTATVCAGEVDAAIVAIPVLASALEGLDELREQAEAADLIIERDGAVNQALRSENARLREALDRCYEFADQRSHVAVTELDAASRHIEFIEDTKAALSSAERGE